MKKRLFTIVIAMVLVTSMFCACSKSENSIGDISETIEDEESIKTNETIENVEETKEIVEETTQISGVVGDVVEEETTNTTLDENVPIVSKVSTWEFPSTIVGSGYTEKGVLVDDPSTSINTTHYEDSEYNLTVDFSWRGPTTLGNAAYTVESSFDNDLFLIDSKDWTYSLHYWYGGTLTNEEDYMKNQSKDAILGSTAEYVSNDYYDIYEDESMWRVIYSIYNNDYDNAYRGYACYIDDYKTNTCYQFEYVERNSVYDDARALALVESIVTNPNVDN